MKANALMLTLFFLLRAEVFQLPAQENEADRKLLAETRVRAEKGDAKAQSFLGEVFFLGELGLAKDGVEAVKWFRRAAEQNEPGGQNGLGNCFAEGEGVPKDEAEAIKWFRKAAEQNNAYGQYRLGAYYYFGQVVPKDEAEAVKWLRKAAEQEYSYAQYALGVCYDKGEGLRKDKAEALSWFRKAAEQNHASAQYNLGVCYSQGEGVAKDYLEAHKWMLLAGAQAVPDAQKGMTILENKMSREQIAEGQKLARDFKQRKMRFAGRDISSTNISQMRPASSGTGFFITEDGYLITNEHLAGNGAQLRLVTASGLISAKVVKVDTANDLALLKAEGKFAPLPVVASRAVKLGGTVATVGFPNTGLQGFAPKLAKGEIASLSGAQDDPRYFQISVPVQPGNSGGALLDERGNVVGVVSAKLNASAALSTSGSLPENVNYAVKSSFLLSFLESLPAVSAKLKEPGTKEVKFEDIVKSAENAAVLVLVY